MDQRTMTPEQEARYLAAVRDLADPSLTPSVTVTLPAFSAFTIIGQIQLALRHPENRGAAADIARGFVSQLQRALRLYNPLIVELIEAGWDKANDRPWDGKVIAERTCRVCGCTDRNCSGCVERTGQPCYWVEADLCSACLPRAPR